MIPFLVYLFGGVTGAAVTYLVMARKPSKGEPARFQPVTRIKRSLKAVAPRKSRKRSRVWLEQDEPVYRAGGGIPPRPRKTKVVEPDNRPRLTPPPHRRARLVPSDRLYIGSRPFTSQQLQEMVNTLRAQQGHVDDDGNWVPRSLDEGEIDPPDFLR